MSHFVTDILLVILGLVASVIIVLSIVGIGIFLQTLVIVNGGDQTAVFYMIVCIFFVLLLLLLCIFSSTDKNFHCFTS